MIEVNWTSYATRTLLDLDYSDLKRLVLAVSELRSFRSGISALCCETAGARRNIEVEGFELHLLAGVHVVEICEVRVRAPKGRAS